MTSGFAGVTMKATCPYCDEFDVVANRHGSVCLTCNHQYGYNLTDIQERMAMELSTIIAGTLINALKSAAE